MEAETQTIGRVANPADIRIEPIPVHERLSDYAGCADE